MIVISGVLLLVADARQKAAALEAAAATERQNLERRVEELRAFEREYRTRLKAYLEGQLRELESQPASAAPAPPPGGGTRGAGSPPPSSPSPAPAASAPPGPPASPSRPPAGPPTAEVPRLAPAPAPGGAPAPSSPFSQAPPMVEDVDSGSDSPTGPPREPGSDHDVDTSGGNPG